MASLGKFGIRAGLNCDPERLQLNCPAKTFSLKERAIIKDQVGIVNIF
jgi:hypothetical protein